MDLAKFLSLLQTRSLYFARADKLGDPFEGSITRLNHDFRDIVRQHRNRIPSLAPYAAMSDQDIEKMFALETQVNQQKLSELYVNCWHLNEHESAAMWRLYTQSSETICVQSTFNRLAKALPPYVYAGKVKYMDYEKEFIPAGNIFNSIMTKRMSFAHEHEIRAVAWSGLSDELGGDHIREAATPAGIPVPIDPRELIEAVYVNPTSSIWFREIIEKLLTNYSVEVPIRQSSLSTTPIF